MWAPQILLFSGCRSCFWGLSMIKSQVKYSCSSCAVVRNECSQTSITTWATLDEADPHHCSYIDNVQLFPDRDKLNYITPVRNCFCLKEMNTYFFRESFTWWFWQTRWTPLKTSVKKNVYGWYTFVCTRVVPKLMPPIYFHGNYTRYKEHNNTIW